LDFDILSALVISHSDFRQVLTLTASIPRSA